MPPQLRELKPYEYFMKKLKLKTVEFGAREMLTREQMKSVLGGTRSAGYYRCCYYVGCATDHSIDHCNFYTNPPDTCTADGFTYPLNPCFG